MNDSVYLNIAKKIDEAPQTAPKAADGKNFHDAFIKYLKLLYSPEEAQVIQYLNVPIAFVTPQQISEQSGIAVEEVAKILEKVHNKNGIVGMGEMYCLPPIQVLINNHHLYTEMKPDDIKAAELHREFFIDGGYSKYYQSSEKGTPMLRTIPMDKSIDMDQKILSAEEAHDFILNHAPEDMSLVPCPCRTRTEKMGIRECKDKFPTAYCIMMGFSALHFDSVGMGKRITRQEAVEYFDEMNELGLVGTTSNAVNDAYIICLCCGCCCSILRGRTRWDNPHAPAPSNFIPKTGEECVGCATCVDRCQLTALSVDEDSGQAVVEPDLCIGCGVCAIACPTEALKLVRHDRSTPFNNVQELLDTVTLENRDNSAKP